MNNRADFILSYDAPRLFTRGACHVFAAALNERYGWPLCVYCKVGDSVRANDSGLHVACIPEKGVLLDSYGWIDDSKYRDLWRPDPLSFRLISMEELMNNLPHGPVVGALCDDADFWEIAMDRATCWIRHYPKIFSGEERVSIPNFTRMEFASVEDLFS